jgi:hypothetical protein
MRPADRAIPAEKKKGGPEGPPRETLNGRPYSESSEPVLLRCEPGWLPG